MKILRGLLAIVLGFVAGGFVNMGLVLLGPLAIAPPAGVNVNDVESLRASIHLFEPRHFLFPFLAHALGTLVGALVAYMVAASCRSVFSHVIGVLTLAGGVAAAFMIPAPGWFLCLDLMVAYIPMAWLATVIGGSRFQRGARQNRCGPMEGCAPSQPPPATQEMLIPSATTLSCARSSEPESG